MSIESSFDTNFPSRVLLKLSLKYSSTDALVKLMREVAMQIFWKREIFDSANSESGGKVAKS